MTVKARAYKIRDLFTGEERAVEWFNKKFGRTFSKPNPERIIMTDGNHKPRKADYESVEKWHEALATYALGSKCVCTHPNFEGGVCTYKTCYHNLQTHCKKVSMN
jgi:hypothetical protein